MSIQGQILETSERGVILKKVINVYKPKNIVEIGTWKGLGSTKCILDSISDEMIFYSIESNKEFYEIAKQNLEQYHNKFNLLYGAIINEEELNNHIKTLILDDTQNSWLKSDLNDIKKCENIENLLPEKIDFLMLDGGEFSTYLEWLKLKDKTKIVALDDVKSLKCNQIYRELRENPNYELIEETNEGNGFCAFKKIN